MHADEAALLKAVCAAPDDDLPRLVFADWLDEHGEPLRAEFIRTQIELAKLKRDSARRRKLAYRCRELMGTEGLSLCVESLVPEMCRFVRGFVEQQEISGADLTSDLAGEFRTTPFRRLWVTELVEPAALGAIPSDNNLLALDLIGCDFEDDDVPQLSRMRRFPHLRELGLMCCELDDEAARVLCDRPFFQRLTTLRLGGNPFTDTGRQLLRDHFGERVSFTCERDSDHLYTIQDDDFTVGFGRGHTQLLMLAGPDEGSVAVFDHAGNLLRFDAKPGRGNADPHAIKRRWMTEYGGESSTIRVKRFKFPDGIGIEDFSPTWIQELENPNNREPEMGHDWLSDWLEAGNFRWSWVGDDWWLNREGEVTDT